VASFLFGVAVGLAVIVPVACWYHRRTVQQATQSDSRDRESERLAYVGALASGLAHEVKNPLSTLRLNLQLLEEELGDGPDQGSARMRRRVENLSREVERLNEVLNDYLRFARQHQLRLEEASLNDVLDELLEFVRPEALRHRVEVRSDLGPDVPTSMVDVNRMKQALLNLIVNAFEAMEGGGELMVQTSVDGETITIRITDTGSGIPPEELDNIFRVYYSTKKTGTGLGLPTARRIIQEHGGELSLESEPGRGTQVCISLPVRPPREAATSAAPTGKAPGEPR